MDCRCARVGADPTTDARRQRVRAPVTARPSILHLLAITWTDMRAAQRYGTNRSTALQTDMAGDFCTTRPLPRHTHTHTLSLSLSLSLSTSLSTSLSRPLSQPLSTSLSRPLSTSLSTSLDLSLNLSLNLSRPLSRPLSPSLDLILSWALAPPPPRSRV